ncbi:MAG: TIGR00299 family protein [Acidobacteria bacterium RIFCSPLOWO2_12_FULL_54_10]|nr:MAG: TIGR00299 family protein [Acidobacteria bacterium RIFCSPLOWO2_12_FULL_54_10]
MKIAYLDCFAGVSGDMLLAAWIGCGASQSRLEEQIQGLDIDGLRLSCEPVKRGAFAALKVTVQAPPDQPHRHYSKIAEIIGNSRLSESVRKNSLDIFRRLGEAEAAVHGTSLEKVHFHEVGALDSIADIVGTCAALEMLGIDELHCSPLNVGSGTVQTQHGLLPVPAPATAELLKGIPVYSSGPSLELVTPTGAAIVSHFAKSFGPVPPMTINNIGYGAGSNNPAGFANVLRILLGESQHAQPSMENLLVLEANLDDMNPQWFGYFAEKAFEAGALDVYFAPIYMKKNRPGVVLSLLCRPDQKEIFMNLFFRETTTLGIRGYEVFRRALDREFISVSTPFGDVRVKISRHNGHILHHSPEYEDCRLIAEQKNIPLREVFEQVSIAFSKSVPPRT